MNVDLIVASSIFIIFISAVFFYLFGFQKQVPSWQSLIELRKRAAELMNEILDQGKPENWEKENLLPSQIGLASSAYLIPILISDVSGYNRINEPIAQEIVFDEDCRNIAWNGTIRIFDENFSEIPFKFVNQTFCPSGFLQKAILFFEVNVSANSTRKLQIFFYNSTQVKPKDYGNFSSLVLWLKFDEGSGNVAYDYSGNGNNGYIYGAGWVDGKVGKALDFDGVDDYVNVSNFIGSFNQLTIEAWIYPRNYSNHRKIIDFGGDYGSGLGRRFTLQLAADGIDVDLDGGLSGRAKWYSTPMNQWLHLVGSWNGTSFIRLYGNGEVKAENTQSPNITALSILSTDARTIGRGITALDYFNGTIDEVKIYSIALTNEEILSHYQQPLSIKVFPKTQVSLISFEKIEALRNISYDLLKDILQKGYDFRVEVYEK